MIEQNLPYRFLRGQPLKSLLSLNSITMQMHELSTSYHGKKLINGVYSAIKIHYRFTRFWTKTRSWKPNIMEYTYACRLTALTLSSKSHWF